MEGIFQYRKAIPGGRKSIKDAFPEVDISKAMERITLGHSSVPHSSRSDTKSSLLRTLIRRKDGTNVPCWPKWSTLSKSSDLAGIPMNFTIRIQPAIMDYTKASSKEGTAAEVFEDAASHIISLRKTLDESESSEKLEEAIIDEMTMAIYGSNFIERVGLGLDETIQICRMVYTGVNASTFSPRSSEYQKRLEQFVQESGKSLHNTKVRDRREVVNHAGALMYMIDRVINNNEPFSEELICATHKILVSGVDAIHEKGPATRSEEYAGVYRRVHVSAGSNNFVTPNFVSRAMKRFVEDLNEQLSTAEENQELDPFFIAADAAGEFVNIHPFLDGNGRTCRLILNTILLKYAGILAPIGEHEYEREEYLDIARRRGTDESGNGELALYTLHKANQTLRRLREKLRS